MHLHRPVDSRPTHLLYAAAAGGTVESGPLACLICGVAHASGVDVSRVLPETFTNHGMARVPTSRSVCLACHHYFTHRWRPEGSKKPHEYRLNSLLVTAEGWQSWPRERMRADIEGWLREGSPGGVYVVSLAKKKHLLPLAAVNPPGSRIFCVQVEEERVHVVADAWLPVAAAFDALLAMGCLKGEVLRGEYGTETLRRLDLTRWRECDRVIASWRPSGLLTLVSYTTLLEDAGERDT